MNDLIDCPLKAASSSLPAWIDEYKTWTYRELDELADRYTEAFYQKGIKEGSRIAIDAKASPFTVALLFAAWRLHASVCLLHKRLTSLGRKLLLKKINPDLTVLDILALDTSSKRLCLNTLDPHLSCLFILTSGSTAEPKIAVLSSKSLLINAQTAASFLDLRPKDQWLLQLPLFHVGGIGIVLRCILTRATIVTNSQSPFITHMSQVPTQLYRATPMYKNLRFLLLGGAPVFSYPTHLPVVVTYGLTEMGSMVLAKKSPIKNGYLGFGLPQRNVRLGEDGEIFVGGECLFQGYWQNNQIEPPDSWFATKDLGEIHPEEGIKILGRKDFQFISGGENIQPEEIEKYLLKIPGVQEAVVVPRKDLEFGFRPVAFVVGSLALKQMKEALSPYLPSYKIPVDLKIVQELPKKGAKIDRKSSFLTALK